MRRFDRTEGKLPATHLTVESAGLVILYKNGVVLYAHEATLNEKKEGQSRLQWRFAWRQYPAPL